MKEAVVTPARSVAGTFRPPSDKSLTHRAFMLAAAASSPSTIHQPLLGEDCRSTLRCLEAMGAGVELGDDRVTIAPADSWITPNGELDCGNSGTTMRLLAGMIGSRPIEAILTGDESLRRRPMRRIAEPLRQMGIVVEGDAPPIRIRGSVPHGIDYCLPVASAQVKSCVLLAGLRAEGETWVTEPSPSRDHTERMLESLGVDVMREGFCRVGVRPSGPWQGFESTIPGDISSAAFWLAAAAAIPGGCVTAQELGVNPTRTGVIDVLRKVGAEVILEHEHLVCGEPVADVTVRFGRRMAFTISEDLVPRLVDEIPVLAVLATQCKGRTEIRDASELRVKESDRLAQVSAGLRAMGASVTELPDGMLIEGPTPMRGTTINAEGDHRLAMAFSIAGLLAAGETRILNAQSIETSYPEFFHHMDHMVAR